MCGSWQRWTRSCIARVTSALSKSWSAMYCRGSDSDSECDASSSNCGDFGHLLHVADPPLKRRCIQVVHVVDDF